MSERLKRGTVRESDGWRFGGYRRCATSFKEVWLSPAAYDRWIATTKTAVKDWQQRRKLQPQPK
jgi:hypothetical protein